MKLHFSNKKKFLHYGRIVFWFFVGVFVASFLISSFAFIIFEKNYSNLAYPGVSVNGIDLSKKNRNEIKNYFDEKNDKASDISFIFRYQDLTATASAKDIKIGYDSNLISDQAVSVGRSQDPVSNLSLIVQAYVWGINLPPSYSYSENDLTKLILPVSTQVNKAPVDALFQFQNGKVSAFRPSSDGKQVDSEKLGQTVIAKAPIILSANSPKIITTEIPVKTLKPELTTEKVNNLGIKELIGVGTSLFQHSIPERVFNVTLAASRVNGSLVAPGENFSFDKALGDVSAFTGYKQAYVIQNGHTILGDGGGVCQVSTTFFRALLDAGLPITDRTAHAYRVGYYEEDSPPGIDATIYVPSVDLKFKNDTSHSILVQTVIDPDTLRLTVYLYGTKDGRKVSMTTPVVSGQTAPPPPLYQDDPTLPSGTIKQTDFEAWGANVSFTRTVTKNGKVIISDKFLSNYKPWQAVFLRGTM